MRYSQESKDNVAARLLNKELSISEAVEQYSIGNQRSRTGSGLPESKLVAARCPTKEIPSSWPASSSLKE